MNLDQTAAYDRATLKAEQLEALLSATVEGCLDTLAEPLRVAYLGACSDAAAEIKELLGKIAPAKVPAAA